MKIIRHILTLITLGLMLWSCGGAAELPIYGERGLDEHGDTVYHQIQNFSLINQDSQVVTSESFENKVYIADFFFINCPNICIAMTGQKLRIYEALKEYPDFMMISHTVDPKRDSVEALNEFATNIEASADQWHFVTGEESYIHQMAAKSYLMAAREDEEAPGGYLHQDKLVLVDRNGRIRGMYSGVDKERVDQLIYDARRLLLLEK